MQSGEICLGAGGCGSPDDSAGCGQGGPPKVYLPARPLATTRRVVRLATPPIRSPQSRPVSHPPA